MSAGSRNVGWRLWAQATSVTSQAFEGSMEGSEPGLRALLFRRLGALAAESISVSGTDVDRDMVLLAGFLPRSIGHSITTYP